MKKYVAEMIGTFALVFVGTGAIVTNQVSNEVVTHVGIAITFGLIVMAMIYSIGDISGAHINPAVTIAFWVAGRVPGKLVAPYIFSQLSGAIVASFLLKILFMDQTDFGTTLPNGTWHQSFILEIILTFILMFVILNVSTGAKEKGIMAGAAIGSVVALEAMFAGPVCGASMNPARSLAPALASNNLGQVWIYLTAPVLGAMLAVPVWKLIQEDGATDPESKQGKVEK